MRNLLTLACAVFWLFALNQNTVSAQTLSAGDIAFSGYNFDNPDEFSFVVINAIPAGEQIHFTDCGWLAASGFRSGEGHITWTCPAGGLTCGTEVTITDGSPFSADVGTVTDAATFALSSSGDQIIAYQGTVGSPTIITAIHSDGATWNADATSSNTSAIPAGMTDGANVMAIAEVDNVAYNCAVTNDTPANIRTALNTAGNYNTHGSIRFTLGVNCPITCGAPGNTISTSAIAGSPFCVSASSSAAVSVDFTSTGTFIGGNTYTAQLSDPTGDFTSPTNIGTLSSTANSGTIAATIPAGTAGGTAYRIRVIADNPATTGTDNGTDLEIVLYPQDATSHGSTPGDQQAQITWTNPAACFDDILIVGVSGGSVTVTPTGDGTAYTANSVFGSGTDLGGNEYAVYKGAGTNVTITGLTNGVTYCFKLFTRNGTEWSSGVETCVIPVNATTFQLGDLAVLGINANDNACSGVSGEDVISFVCFRDITTGTALDFTDNGFERCNANQWGNTEGTIRATRSGGTILAGTIITFKANSTGGYSATAPDASWTFAEINFSANFNLNNGGDQIHFMQGGTWNQGNSNSHDATYTGGTVMFGFTTNNTWSASCGTSPTQHSNLFSGLTCFNMGPTGSTDYSKYTGSTTAATRSQWIARINDASNWTSYANCTDFNTLNPLPASITISAGGWLDGKWVGGASTDWFDCANWETLEVPDATINVTIPTTGVTNEPTIATAGAECDDITIKSGRTLSINGSGTLEINGDLTKDGNLAHSAGTVTIANASSQISSSGSTLEFFNLVIAKSTAAQTVTVNSPFEVSNSMTFTSGKVLTTAVNLLTIQDDATVSGASNNSFVDGPIEKEGDDAFTFPVGDLSNYAPIAISAPALGTDAFTAQYLYADPEVAFGSPLAATIDHISDCEYWVLDQSQGTPTAEVTLPWNGNSCGVTVLCDLTVARWDGATWQDHGNGGTSGNTSTGTVVSGASCTTPAAVTSFSPFTLASTTTANPLPVELLSFTATPNGHVVDLGWATATEIDNDYFTIERSADAINFEPIKEVDGAGNSYTTLFYSTTDAQPLSGISYYRLKQTDFDGTASYSQIVSVNFNISVTPTIQYVHSTSQSLDVYYSSTNGNLSVEIFDVAGRVIYTSEVAGSGSRIEISEEAFSAGVYFVRLTNAAGSDVMRFKK